MSYKENLGKQEWKEKRLFVLKRDNFVCQKCHSKSEKLHVHHKIYIKSRKPWQYNDKDLITLCDTCHSWVHGTENVKVYSKDKKEIIQKESIKKEVDIPKMEEMLSKNDKTLNEKYNRILNQNQTVALPDLYKPKELIVTKKMQRLMDRRKNEKPKKYKKTKIKVTQKILKSYR